MTQINSFHHRMPMTLANQLWRVGPCYQNGINGLKKWGSDMKTTYFIALSGLRGGVGTTSMVALLADALCAQGEAVLVVDLNPADLLRLHFNTPYEEKKGWALSRSTAHGWREQCYQRGRLLQVLPYGYHGLSDAPVREPQAIPIWRQLIQYVWTEADEGQPDWVLFDAPAAPAQLTGLHRECHVHFLVCNVDIAAHYLLGQYRLVDNVSILLNQLNPQRALDADILLDWGLRYCTQISPARFLQDSHVHEALAHKSTAVRYFPESAAAHEAGRLAAWCLEQRRGP